MAITIDELKRNVFPGESGGDYNALFGYSNRPGGQFSGVNLTDMTVDQALQFANPSGPYGQSVKGQIGRVATPMGAYQVVGTTLRGAKEGLGLTGNEVMTPQLQDAIGMWIYRNQGPQAWEAWGGGQGGGNVTRSSKGTGMGLLDMQAQQPQTFGQKIGEGLRSGSLMDNLALAFNSLRMNPDQGLATMVGQRQEQRGQEQAANRTAQWLRSRGHDDLASALEAGSIDAGSTVNEALSRERPAAPPEQTALMQNVQWMMSQGIPMERALEMARGGTTVNVGGEGQPAPQLLGTSGLVAIPDPSVPQGYRVEPAPGSPLAEERAAAEQKTAERERQTSIRMGTTLENLNLNIKEIEDGGVPVTGMAGAVGRMFPGTPAADFANRTAQINTRAALDEVQSMRDNSPTGGAVGQLTDSEREAIGMAATSMNDASSAPEYMRNAKLFREVMLDVAYGAGKWSIDANGQVQVKTTLPTAPAGGAPVVIDGVTIRKVN